MLFCGKIKKVWLLPIKGGKIDARYIKYNKREIKEL